MNTDQKIEFWGGPQHGKWLPEPGFDQGDEKRIRFIPGGIESWFRGGPMVEFVYELREPTDRVPFMEFVGFVNSNGVWRRGKRVPRPE